MFPVLSRSPSFFAGALVFAGLLAGCDHKSAHSPAASASPPPAAVAAAPAAPAAPAEKTWPLTGEVIGVNRERKTLLVTHDEIKGFMPAMTMEFAVGDGDLAIAKEGARIRATLVQSGDDYRLERIWPDDARSAGEIAAGAEALQKDTAALDKKIYPFREVGDTLPNFTLYDQDGKVVEIARFRGKRLVLNFIFTRCPFVNMCPASTLRMMALQQAAREQGIANLELVSVTLDPAYDTPGVLKDYAAVRGIDTGHFSFLTGPEAAVKNLLKQLGVTVFEEEGLLKHSLATLLIDETGKIAYRDDSESWQPATFIAHLKKG